MKPMENELELGEVIALKITRGRGLAELFSTLPRTLFVFPMMGYLSWKFFSDLLVDFPQPTSVDPPLVQFLVPLCLSSCMYVPALMLVSVSVFDLIHLFTDFLVLTNKRIFGRAQSRFMWSFRPVDIRLEDVLDIKVKNLSMEIQINGEHPILISRLDQQQEFIARFQQLKNKKPDCPFEYGGE